MKRQTLLRFASVAMLLGASLLAEASHFRYGNLTWQATGTPHEALFELQAAFRRNGYGGTGGDGFPVVGDIITEFIGASQLLFGDGAVTPTLRFEVIAFSATENWLIGRALEPGSDDPGVHHTYASGGPFIASLSGCCRISNLNNGADQAYLLRSIVTPDNGNSPPATSLVPIITVAESATASFTVPANDFDGDTLRFRVAGAGEAGVAAAPNFTIDPNTGVVSWNNVGFDQVNPWTAQVIIEDLGPGGVVKSQTPVDFLMFVVPNVGNPPDCSITPSGPLSVTAGTPVSFTITGTDPDAGAVLTLNTGGLPSGATMTPGLPTVGASPLSSTFDWTPTVSQGGSYVVLFTVSDETRRQTACSIGINVVTNLPPEVHCGSGAVGCGDVRVSFTISDPEGDEVKFTISVDGSPSTPFTLPAGSAPIVLDSILPFSVGVHTLVLEATDGRVSTCSLEITMTADDDDLEPPHITCFRKRIPSGYVYDVIAADVCTVAEIFVKDPVTGTRFGPYPDFSRLHIRWSSSLTPASRPWSGGTARLDLKGPPEIIASDANGNEAVAACP